MQTLIENFILCAYKENEMPFDMSGTDVDVWETFNPPQSLADEVFATTSTNNIELTNDYEPVAYQANRALMAANAAQELNELQERSHATTAYSTLGCVAKPLFPAFDAQRAAACAQNEAAGVGMRDPPGTVTRASGEPPIGYRPRYNLYPARARASVAKQEARKPVATKVGVEEKVEGKKKEKMKKDRGKFLNSLRGALYDAKHWSELPGESTAQNLEFVCTRDDRGAFLMLFLTIIVFLVTLVAVAISVGVQSSKDKAMRMEWFQRQQQRQRHLYQQPQPQPQQPGRWRQ
jgi:hypothetical protein